MNYDTLLIDENDLEVAKNICKGIRDDSIRKRSVRNVFAAKIAKKYFQELEVDIDSGLHNVDKILEQVDIADIYVNDCYIDVRLYFDKNEICIPKQHFEKNILPYAYMCIKLDEDFSNAIVTGFITPDMLEAQDEEDGFYKVDENSLLSYFDIESSLINYNIDDIDENIEVKIFDYIEKDYLGDEEFYRLALNSKIIRNLLINAIKVDSALDSVFSEIELPVSNNDNDNQLTDTELSISEEEDFLGDNDGEFLELSSGSLEELSAENEDFSLLEYENVDSSLDDMSFSLNPDETIDLLQNEDLEEDQDILEEDASVHIDEVVDGITEEIENEYDSSENDIENTESASDINDFEVLSFEEVPEYNEPSVQIETDEILNTLYETKTTPSLTEFDREEGEEEELEELSIIDDEFDSQEIKYENKEDLIEEYSDEVRLEDVLDEESDNFDNNIENIQEFVDTNETEINDLFTNENTNDEILNTNYVRNKNNKFFMIVGLIVVLGAVGYQCSKFIDFSSFNKGSSSNKTSLSQNKPIPQSAKLPVNVEKQDANKDLMPIETVENINPENLAKEENFTSSSTIESNLNVPVNIDNLSVNWEVPSSYIANTTVKRYFSRIGRVIQLNVKAELLLQNKSSITNKIMIELEFDKSSNKFDIKSVLASSGDSDIDDVITATVKKSLDINLKTNMSIFSTLSGNPVLVIYL
ncbi:hypothetical protein IKB17_00300 [bacterium]|nr:hypothetical protein [bacterium]